MQGSAKSGEQAAWAISQAHGPHLVEKVRVAQQSPVSQSLDPETVQALEVLRYDMTYAAFCTNKK